MILGVFRFSGKHEEDCEKFINDKFEGFLMNESRQSPRYSGIFEYLEENYELTSSDNVLTHFYKHDIAEHQYQNLDGPVNDERGGFGSPGEAADVVARLARKAGADLVGFTTVQDHFVFQGAPVPHRFCVVLGVEMDFDIIETSPEPPAGVEVRRAYWTLGTITCAVARFIRFLGYPARAHHPRSDVGFPPTILHTAAAIEAGFGELGRHGVLITEEFGPRVRVATVTTDLPLPPATRKTFGVAGFCETCHLCQEACQGDAIPDEKTEVRGVLKYTLDPYKCLEHFAKYDGCNLCVSKCAFNRRPRELCAFIKSLGKR